MSLACARLALINEQTSQTVDASAAHTHSVGLLGDMRVAQVRALATIAPDDQDNDAAAEPADSGESHLARAPTPPIHYGRMADEAAND